MAERHRALAIERDELLQNVRVLPGFERFLLHKEFSQLCASAHAGPIVVPNAAETHSDALIILASAIMSFMYHSPIPAFFGALEERRNSVCVMSYHVG